MRTLSSTAGFFRSRIFVGVTCHIVESLGFETASGEILRELLEISPVNIVHNPVGAINQLRRETIVFPFSAAE